MYRYISSSAKKGTASQFSDGATLVHKLEVMTNTECVSRSRNVIYSCCGEHEADLAGLLRELWVASFLRGACANRGWAWNRDGVIQLTCFQ